eukprot:CAMPEP_0194777206 /NCGR_PEP_ID=MMETSP0323_2-20130528/65042_1 /TAXON_ID=2866 ORGANISM="Crypthecodinium cohnii, Strain Seligo" /NCGR_SAMPLE_ID=MMETSP0323_2 /ASSEMBLY_ACC=CAM_ASM_000346 /LENGTH=260 /DNA_ID=CAMNT_0039713917 /DNA_START=52 /DNA_END=830 /DNA_ORIENTATION=+
MTSFTVLRAVATTAGPALSVTRIRSSSRLPGAALLPLSSHSRAAAIAHAGSGLFPAVGFGRPHNCLGARRWFANPHVVRLMTRMDEDEELPRSRVLGPVVTPEELAQRPRPGGGVFGSYVPLYLGPSAWLEEEGGRGVFTAEAIREGDIVEVCPVLALHRDHVATECAGMRYFFAGQSGDSVLCVLGWGMMYNHAPSLPADPSKRDASKRYANLNYSLREPPEDQRDERDGGVCVRFEAARDLQAGEELLIDYSDRWWEA